MKKTKIFISAYKKETRFKNDYDKWAQLGVEEHTGTHRIIPEHTGTHRNSRVLVSHTGRRMCNNVYRRNGRRGKRDVGSETGRDEMSKVTGGRGKGGRKIAVVTLAFEHGIRVTCAGIHSARVSIFKTRPRRPLPGTPAPPTPGPVRSLGTPSTTPIRALKTTSSVFNGRGVAGSPS